MRSLFVLALSLVLIAMPVVAQETGGKTKTQPPARTLVESLRMSSGLAAVNAFITAYAASDYVSAYFLLSPGAKTDFLTGVNDSIRPGCFRIWMPVLPPAVCSTRIRTPRRIW